MVLMRIQLQDTSYTHIQEHLQGDIIRLALLTRYILDT